MDSIVNQIEQLLKTADTSSRHIISHKLRGLAASVETPREAILRHTYLANQLAPIVQVAADLDILKTLVESENPLTVDSIAQKCGADPILIGRILRFMASEHVISEVDESKFKANNTTQALATPAGTASIAHGFYFMGKCFDELPTFLKANKYASPNDALETPFQIAFKTDQALFNWAPTQPVMLNNFLNALPGYVGPKPWTDAVEFTNRLQSADRNAPLFVDVGGGPGGQCTAFRKVTAERFPGRVVLQDLPGVLDMAPAQDGVEKIAQNFFEGQVVKGAVFYYLRNVLHDWPDAKCLEILGHQIAAMGPASTLLLDELIVPNEGASSMTTQYDIAMLSTLAGIERTEAQWRVLLNDAGLDIVKITGYDPEMEYSIIEAVPRQRK